MILHHVLQRQFLRAIFCVSFFIPAFAYSEVALPKHVKPGPVPAAPKVVVPKTGKFAIRRMASVDSEVNQVYSIGPSLLLGLPHPLNFAVNARFGHRFQASLGGGSLSHTFTVSNSPIAVSLANFEGRFRYFPFEGSFFCGVALGHQSLGGDADVTTTVGATQVPVHAKLSISGMYASPHIGWLWTWSNGLIFGMEFGAQIPVSSTSTLETSTSAANASQEAAAKATAEYKAREADLNDIGKKIGKQVFPLVTLIHFGWMFDL